MANLDEVIAQALVDHQINLMRFDAGERKTLLKKLVKLERQLKAELLVTDLTKRKEVEQSIESVADIVKEFYGEVSDDVYASVTGLWQVEQNATAGIINSAIGATMIKASDSAFDGLMLGSPLKDWWREQGTDLAFKFGGMVRNGVINGKTNQVLALELVGMMDVKRTAAKALISTGIASVTGAARDDLYQANDDLIGGYIHTSTLDFRTTNGCKARDGKAWTIDKKPIGHDIPFAQTPLHVNCRSILRPLIKSWADLGISLPEIPKDTRATMDGQVSSEATYEGWLKSKSEAQQNATLGHGKAKMWRDGKITFNDMLDQTGRELTLDELRQIYN